MRGPKCSGTKVLLYFYLFFSAEISCLVKTFKKLVCEIVYVFMNENTELLFIQQIIHRKIFIPDSVKYINSLNRICFKENTIRISFQRKRTVLMKERKWNGVCSRSVRHEFYQKQMRIATNFPYNEFNTKQPGIITSIVIYFK